VSSDSLKNDVGVEVRLGEGRMRVITPRKMSCEAIENAEYGYRLLSYSTRKVIG
jgi:hypothetical protein